MSKDLVATLDAIGSDMANMTIYRVSATLLLQRLRDMWNDQDIHPDPSGAEQLIIEFQDQMKIWSQYSYIMYLAHEDEIRTFLQKSLELAESLVSSSCKDEAPSRASQERIFSRLTMLREQSEAYINLSNLLHESKEDLLSLRGNDVTVMINMLHQKTNVLPHTDELRHICWTRLLELAIANEKLPSALDVGEITDRSVYPITGGNFGDVYSAYYKGGKVAIKIMRLHGNNQDMHRRICREILIWHQLSHPHVLPFIGISHDFPPYPAIVSPWMDNGNLLIYIKLHEAPDVLRLLRQTASALGYLHLFNPTIIHRDLRCANILVDNKNDIVLADFGISSVEDAASRSIMTTAQAGNARWKSPELLFGDAEPSRGSDIWAFGMVIIEVFTKNAPFYSIMADGGVIVQIHMGKKPSRPENMDDSMWELTLKCWKDEPEDRISAIELQETLAGLQRMEASKPKESHSYGSPRAYSLAVQSKSKAERSLINQTIQIYLPSSVFKSLMGDQKLINKFEQSLDVVFTLPEQAPDNESREKMLEVYGTPEATKKVYREIKKLLKLERLASGITWTSSTAEDIRYVVKGGANLAQEYSDSVSKGSPRSPRIPPVETEDRKRTHRSASRHPSASYNDHGLPPEFSVNLSGTQSFLQPPATTMYDPSPLSQSHLPGMAYPGYGRPPHHYSPMDFTPLPPYSSMSTNFTPFTPQPSMGVAMPQSAGSYSLPPYPAMMPNMNSLPMQPTGGSYSLPPYPQEPPFITPYMSQPLPEALRQPSRTPLYDEPSGPDTPFIPRRPSAARRQSRPMIRSPRPSIRVSPPSSPPPTRSSSWRRKQLDVSYMPMEISPQRDSDDESDVDQKPGTASSSSSESGSPSTVRPHRRAPSSSQAAHVTWAPSESIHSEGKGARTWETWGTEDP